MPTQNIIGTSHTLLPCEPEGYQSLQRLHDVCPDACVSVSMNSCFDEHDTSVHGWYVKLPATTPAPQVPFTSNMFDGITVVETMANEEQILSLLKVFTVIFPLYFSRYQYTSDWISHLAGRPKTKHLRELRRYRNGFYPPTTAHARHGCAAGPSVACRYSAQARGTWSCVRTNWRDTRQWAKRGIA